LQAKHPATARFPCDECPVTAFRFLHTADLHLGRRFGALPEDLRGRLVEARHALLPNLAQAATRFGAGHILLAGDTFDSETPSDPVWRQALVAMGAAQVQWWIIPGNHDSLAAESLWSRLAQHAPANVRLLTEARPVQIAPGVTLLPCPLPRRYPGRDLTAWMAEVETPPGQFRIGLAHGAIRDFSSDGSGADGIIPPDRAATARLDYLALGDWHGRIEVNPRTFYPGTPERDAAHPDARGTCLAVTLPAPGALPVVETLPTGRFHWTEDSLALLPGQDAAALLADRLPADRPARRDQLLRLRVTGRATLSERAALAEAVAAAAPDFAALDLDLAALDTEVEAADLDEIDRAGALRLAAERLRAAAEDPARAEGARRISAAALNRLFGYLREDRA